MSNYKLSNAIPLNGHIIVKLDENEEKKSDSGLELSIKPVNEQVISTGTVIHRPGVNVGIGKRIMFQTHRIMFSERQEDGSVNILLPEEYALAIIS